MPYASGQSAVGIAKESTRGTGVVPALWLPTVDPKWEPKLNWIQDPAYRGSPVESYDMNPGAYHQEWSAKGPVIADTFPPLLQMILGSTDTIAGSGPYTHTIGVLNAQATGSQPPSYTITDVDGYKGRQINGGQASALNLNWAADGTAQWDATVMGLTETDVSYPTLAFTTENQIPGWDITLTVAGSAVNNTSGSLSIARPVTPKHTVGQQTPYVLFAGRVKVTGSLTMILESTDTTLASGLARTQQAVVLTMTDPVSSHSIALTMSKCQFQDPKIDRSEDIVLVMTNFEAIANTTDAISGYAPIKTVSTNARSTAY